MVDPLFWLGLSILLVAVSLTAVLMAALPAFRELARASRSAEKLFDTLNRELPPTLEAIRLTSMEITELTDDITPGVQNTGRVTQQVDQSISSVKTQAKQAQVTTKSVFAGIKAAWRTFNQPESRSRSNAKFGDAIEQLPASDLSAFEPEAEVESELDDLAIDTALIDDPYLESEQFESEASYQPNPLSPSQTPRRQLPPNPDEIQRIEQQR